MQNQITVDDADTPAVAVRRRMTWDNFVDTVIMTTVELTGELLPIDDIPYRAIRWHYDRGDPTLVAAREIIQEDKE